MQKHLCLVLFVCAGGASAADTGLGLAEVVWEHPLADRFSFSSEHGTWNRAERVAVEFRLPTDDGESVSPWGGLHIGGDTRSGTLDKHSDGSGGGEVDANALVLALTGGGRFHLFSRMERENFDPAFSLFGRAGVGFQEGQIGGYQTAQGTASGDLSPIRYEFALGTAFELALGKKMLLSAGLGVTWMFANQATLIRVDNGQSSVAVSATYAGVEGFTRLGLGIRF